MTTEISTICGITDYEKKNIFKIIRLDRLKVNTCSYVFVGEQPNNIKQSLSNLELTGKPDALLKSHFKKYYDIITKHKTPKFKFIYQHIYEDDTITTIRKKIFCLYSFWISASDFGNKVWDCILKSRTGRNRIDKEFALRQILSLLCLPVSPQCVVKIQKNKNGDSSRDRICTLEIRNFLLYPVKLWSLYFLNSTTLTHLCQPQSQTFL